MELVNFSVTNFRSITKAHRVSLSNTTILIGKNNEGKSNLLKALDVAMTALERHVVRRPRHFSSNQVRLDEKVFNWQRDFPINLQDRKSGTQTIIRLEFKLTEEETEAFTAELGSKLNGSLPISIKIGKDNEPAIQVLKRGKGSKTLNTKSGRIAKFIAEKITFNYIPAIRTDQEAMNVVSNMLAQELRFLESDQRYQKALQVIRDLQQPVLDELSQRIKAPLSEFLPSIKNVAIDIPENRRRYALRHDFEIVIDDGTPTSLSHKGDGVKSLAALGLLKDSVKKDGASIIAIEEPESHLHPAAIHQLNEIIRTLGVNNQVILTTHNPLFVDRVTVRSNIVVSDGKATPAKNIKEIRDLLGIRASDNLTNARFVLVVEGGEDVVSIRAILAKFSETIRKALQNNMLIIEPIGGASNLPYKLTLLKNALCVYHCLLDNDDAGRSAFEGASKADLVLLKNVTMINCNGFKDSEFEDCLNLSVYEKAVHEEFGVNLNTGRFKGNKKWSDRVKTVFLNAGKPWNDKLESQVKRVVSESVAKSPSTALNDHHKGPIDALIEELERLLKNKDN